MPQTPVLQTNALGLPIGNPVKDWVPPPAPEKAHLAGTHCRLEPLDAPTHASQLHQANLMDLEHRIWTYLAYGPFETEDAYRAWATKASESNDSLFYAIIDQVTQSAVGVASYLRIDPSNGVIEVGHLNFAPPLQATPAATEAMFLMMRHVFELGYRRYEWKCDSLNERSRRAAERYGFQFEGIFRQATVYKERNRDTAWFSIIDQEWPTISHAFETWLALDNFDEQGRQRRSLATIREALAS